MKMRGVVEIEKYAFGGCYALSELEFGKLEMIGNYAFANCRSLKFINMSSIRILRPGAFEYCGKLTEAVFGVKLERIEKRVFLHCESLGHITIPLKDNFTIGYSAFKSCENFGRVGTLAGGIHKTISFLHLKTWRDEMEAEIDRINQTLPNTSATQKSRAIKKWIIRVLGRMEHYKSEHKMLLKEAMTLLELALWKAKLLNKETDEKKCNVRVSPNPGGAASSAKVNAPVAYLSDKKKLDVPQSSPPKKPSKSPTGTAVTNDSSKAAPPLVSVSNGWGDIFASQMDQWKCSVCTSQNPKYKTVCLSCEIGEIPRDADVSFCCASIVIKNVLPFLALK